MPAPPPPDLTRADFPHLLPIQTRWMDNDVYGHANNVVYYSWFDTVINRYLLAESDLDLTGGDTIGVCVESQCRYLASVAFPDRLEAGLRVDQLGRSSVRYQICIFRDGQVSPSAIGHFVHVFVSRATRRPMPIPDRIRAALERLRTPPSM